MGYLATTSTGALAGRLTSTSTNVTVVGISQAQVAGSSSSLPSTESINYTTGSSSPPASIGRIPQYAAQALGLRSGIRHLPEGPTLGPAEERALRSRLRPAGRLPLGSRATQSVSVGLPQALNSSAMIWVNTSSIGSSNGGYVQIAAHLQYNSTHGNIWVADSLLTGTNPLTSSDFPLIGAAFDNAYVSDTTHFGPATYTSIAPGLAQPYGTCSSTGVSDSGSSPQYVAPNNGQIAVVILDTASLGTGVGGYFADVNFTPQAIWNCLLPGQTVESNETPMIYVGYDRQNPHAYNINEDLVRGTAHEFQHLVNFVNHGILSSSGAIEDSFINEGLSMLAQDLAVPANFAANGNAQVTNDVDDALLHASDYLAAPQNFSITAFSGIDPVSEGGNGTTLTYNCGACYGGEYLLQRYLYDRFGGDAYSTKMVQGSTTSYANIAAATGQSLANVPRLFSDFAIALAASNTSAATPPFTFTGLNLRTTYPSPTGFAGVTLNGPAAAGTLAASGSASTYFGGYFYLTGGSALANQFVSLSDPIPGANFQLTAGVVQR